MIGRMLRSHLRHDSFRRHLRRDGFFFPPFDSTTLRANKIIYHIKQIIATLKADLLIRRPHPPFTMSAFPSQDGYSTVSNTSSNVSATSSTGPSPSLKEIFPHPLPPPPPPPESSNRGLRKKREQVSVACGNCQKRKSKVCRRFFN